MGRKRISVESEGNASLAIDERDGELNARVFMQGGNHKSSSSAGVKGVKPQPQPEPLPAESLSSADLGVLKRVK